MWQQIWAKAERGAQAWFDRNTPATIAAYMLLGILLLPIPPAEAHSISIQTADHQSDNLFRWGMANGLGVWAQIDDNITCSPAFCKDGDDRWHIPPHGKLTGVCSGDDAGSVSATNTYDCQLNTRLNALRILGYGGVASFRWTADQSDLSTSKMAFARANDDADLADNFTAFNATFGADVSATNLDFRWRIDTDAAGGTLTTWFALEDAADSSVRVLAGLSIGCNSGKQDINQTFSFDRTTFRKFKIYINHTACTYSNPNVNNVKFSMVRANLWSQGNSADAQDYVSTPLEFGDWMARREGTETSNVVAFNFTSRTNATLILPALTAGYWYSATACANQDFSTEPNACGSYGATWPSTALAANACILTDFAGHAADRASIRSMLHVWRLENTCSTSQVINLGGVFGQTAQRFYEVHGLYPGNAHSYGGGDYRNDLGVPRAVKCFDCTKANAEKTYALFYPSTSGPLKTYPYQTAINEDVNFEENDITTNSLSLNSNGQRTFTISVTNQTYYGNAQYFVIGAYNTTNTPDLCPASATVNGESAPLAWAPNSERSVGGNGFLQLCAYLLGDLHRARSYSDDTQGNHKGQDNARTSGSILWTVTLDFPASARAPNGPASAGYTLQAVQRFNGNHTERISCTAYNEGSLCYGNLDTTGLFIPGSPVTFRTKTLDDNTSLTQVGGIRILDSLTGAGNTTIASGFANFTVVSDTVRLTLTNASYPTYYANMTGFTVGAVEVTFEINATGARPYLQFVGCNLDIANDVARCTWRATANPSLQCAMANVQTSTCTIVASDGSQHAKNYVFVCPVDGGLGSRPVIQRVNVTESVTRTALQTGTVGGSGACSEANTTSIQSPTVDFTFSAPGYRSLRWESTWLTADIIKIYAVMKRGIGDQEANLTRVINTTVNDGGVFKTSTEILIEDLEPAGSSDILGEAGGLPSVSQAIKNFGDSIGLHDTAGNILWGLILWIMLAVVIIMLLGKFTTVNGSMVTFAAVPSFLFVGFLGLWPSWLLLLVALGIVVIGLMAWNRRE